MKFIKIRKALKSNKVRDQFWGYFFILPSLIFFVLFLVYPMIDSLKLSFFKESGPGGYTWVGFENYTILFRDPIFIKALVNTFLYVLYTVPLVIILSLLIAVLLNSKTPRVQSFFRISFYIPTILSAVSVSLVWNVLYNRAFGILNYLMVSLGLEPVAWLGDPKIVLFSLSIVLITLFLGKPIVLNIAGINGIPVTYFEASFIDGANRWQQFWKITLPMLKPTLLYIVTTTTINAFLIFAVIRIMTGGGPNYSSSTVMYMIYIKAFSFGEFAIASTMGVILFICTALISVAQFLLLSKSVEY